MNFIKRAWCYITRKKTKSILLVITFFLIGNLVILGLGISQAAENAKTLTRKQMRAAVSYEVDYDAYWKYTDSITDEDELEEAYKNYPKLDMNVANTIASDERVTAYNCMSYYIMYLNGFESVPVGNESNYNSTTTYYDENGVEQTYTEPNIKVYGNMNPDMIELVEGTYTVTSGEFYSQSDIDNSNKVCLITKELADQNNLRVGDTISITGNDASVISTMKSAGVNTDDMYLEMEIKGIYTTTQEVDTSSDSFQWMSAYESPKNVILCPFTTLAEYEINSTISYYDYMSTIDSSWSYDASSFESSYNQPNQVIFLLEDPLEVESFVSDHESTLGEYTKLNANNDEFKKLSRPLDTLSFFANIIVTIVVVNAVVIISLITALTLKTREYEIGVLLSIGVTKLKVVAQLFVELIVIAVFGFSLAVVSGSLIAGRVGQAVLEYQTATEEQYATDEDSTVYYYSDTDSYFTTVSQEDLLSNYEVKVGPLLIGEIYVVGAGVVLLAILIPSFMIMRLNPKQILLEQN